MGDWIGDWFNGLAAWGKQTVTLLLSQMAGAASLDALIAADPGWAAFSVLAFFLAPELFLVLYTLAAPQWVGLFTLVAIGCSIAGGMLDYGIGRVGGRSLFRLRTLQGMVNHERLDQVKRFFARFGSWTLVVASLMPVPYKPLMISTGVLHVSAPSVLMGLAIGRTLRFGLLGGLLFLFRETFNQSFQAVLVTMTVAVLLWVTARLVRSRRRETAPMWKSESDRPNAAVFAGRLGGVLARGGVRSTLPVHFNVPPPPHSTQPTSSVSMGGYDA
jgi:membrane protein YqaA with SNARE-associated domain